MGALKRSGLPLLAGVTLALAAGLANPNQAAAQVTRTVRLERATPFDAWCIAPVCTQAAGAVPPLPALFKPPASLLPSSSDGLLEQELKARLAAAVSEQARQLDLWSKPLADLSSSGAAALTGDSSALSKASGLTGSVLRVGLTLRARQAVAEQPGCTGRERLDAIYEGLGISVALAPLEFPAATRTVSEACVTTAQATEALVDGLVLRSVVPEELVRAVQQALEQVKATQAACRNVVEQAAPVRVDELLERLKQLQSAGAAQPPEIPPECVAALGPIANVDPAPIAKLRELGLGQAPVGALAGALDAAAAARARVAELVSLLSALVKRGQLARAELEALLQSMARELAPPGATQEVWAHLLAALPAGLSEDASGAALLDPSRVAKALKDAYGLDEHGVPTLRSLLGFKPTPFIADANVGIPSLRDDAFRVVANGRLGYHGESLGVVGRGGIKEFDVEQAGVITQDAHYYGGLDGFVLLGGARSKVRFEARLGALLDYVDTTVISRPGSAGGLDFQDYDSTLIRAGLRVGLRLAPNERLLLRIAGGGGYQFETHDSTALFQNNSFESVDTSSAQGGGNLLLWYRIVPGVVGARLLGDLDYYQLTIDRLAFDFAGAPTLERPQATQLELSGRLFVDLDVVSFGGFVPGAFGGIDYLSRTGAGPSVTSNVPSFGVGLMRRSD